MKIYKLDNKEIDELQKEFNKMAYGKRIYLLATLPIFFGFMCLLMGFIIDILYEIIGIEESELISFWFMFAIGSINISLGCVGQIIYGKELKEYVENKKTK